MEIETCQMHGQVPEDSQYCEVEIGKKANDLKAPTLYGQKFGNICQKRRSESKSKSGLSKNGSSTMLDNRMVLMSLILTMKNSRTFSKNARRKFEVPMPEPDAKNAGKPDQNTHASLKPTNLRESAWKELLIKVMKIISHGKGSID